MLNKVMVIGRLGRDPEIKYTDAGKAVCSFSVATTEYWRDKQGEKQEKTEWINVVGWERLADQAQSYLQKGSVVYIEGKLSTRSWEQEGQKKYKTEVVASQFRFLDSKNDSQGADRRESPPPPSNDGKPSNDSPYIDDNVPF
ncbi:MAG: single-stranded DNA-binding protein [Rickettsiales bacterium]|mgnify:FL=1|nr:single-stranded DNA-binding protein [Rickettsiales bacterium]